MDVFKGKKINTLVPVLLSAALLAAGSSASAQNGIRFEDYRGNAGVPANPPQPHFDNLSRTVNGVGNIPRLMALQGVAGAVVDSGTRSNINWMGRTPELCDTSDIGRNSSSARDACGKWKMGRIAYTVVRFPVAGSIQLRVAHDDDLKVDFSNQITIGSNYRNANWTYEVGQLSNYVAEDRWVALGTYNSPSVGSCALVRMAWVNNGGLNHLRLRYRTTNFNGPSSNADGNIAFADSDFIDPLDVATIQRRCTGAVSAPEVTLAKEIVGGRIHPGDQFTLNVRRGSNVVVSGATSGSQLRYVLPTANLSTGSERIIIEELPSGGAVLANYAPMATCSKTTSGSTAPVSVPLTVASASAAGYSWSMDAPVSGDKVSCTITNTQPSANLTLSKTSSVPTATTLRQGDAVVYTLRADNTGPHHAHGAVISDPVVAGVSCAAVTCQGSNGAVCPSAQNVTVAALQGSGIVIPTFPLNGRITLTQVCTVTATGY